MLNFIAWRIAQFPLILAIIYLITFLFVWVAPGSPFGQGERQLNKQAKEALTLIANAKGVASSDAFPLHDILLTRLSINACFRIPTPA